MKTIFTVALLGLPFGNSTLAESGPFVCACEVDSHTGNSILLVKDLATGRETRMGNFSGTSMWKSANEGQATNACVEALKSQAVCRLGRAE